MFVLIFVDELNNVVTDTRIRDVEIISVSESREKLVDKIKEIVSETIESIPIKEVDGRFIAGHESMDGSVEYIVSHESMDGSVEYEAQQYFQIIEVEMI